MVVDFVKMSFFNNGIIHFQKFLIDQNLILNQMDF
jgi:hypothetical protein